ncbi:MAG: alpha/beta hydrolase [Ruminococcus sp.]|nr:alpha/beta hydrolase [Ruminococcus sp.]
MNFLLCGDRSAPAVLLIHGLGTTAELCYYRVARSLGRKYRVILACLDGHDPRSDAVFESLDLCCEKIERYIGSRFGGSVYALGGFSLGATAVLELVKRGNISAEKLLLDSPCTSDLGLMKIPYTLFYTKGLQAMQIGIKPPNILTDKLFGEGNHAVCELMYKGEDAASAQNACSAAYGYKISRKLKGCSADVQFWCGSREKAPKKAARKLEKYIPAMKVRVFKDLGVGQMLCDHERAYIREMKRFLQA